MRFVKLDWGEGNFFHPDERNIAASVSQLTFPTQMNPNFFAYGSLPIYLYFFLTKTAAFLIDLAGDTFTQSILIGRFFSAIISTVIIYQVYRLGIRWSKVVAIYASSLSAFTVGLVQYAHFSTVEILLAFFYLLIFESIFSYWESGKIRWIVICGVLLGLATATKVTSLLILPIILMGVFVSKKPTNYQDFLKLLIIMAAVLVISTLTFLAVFPYFVFDFKGFISALNYESGVARGGIDVFYTKQYFESQPVVWHFTKVLPWNLGMFSTFILPLAWSVGGIYIMKSIFKSRLEKMLLLTWLWITLFFGWHTTLFVKWIRYMVPILPFLNLLISWFLFLFLEKRKGNFRIPIILVYGLLIGGSIYQSLNFTKVYLSWDTRVAAGLWAREHVPKNEWILSEVYDLGVTSMPEYTIPNTKLYNFYDLDVDNQEERLAELSDELERSDWILIPSRRIYGYSLSQREKYPLAGNYYSLLFDGTLGFEKKADFYINTFRDAHAEETYEVFDHPRVMLFRKIKPLTAEKYINLIKGDF